MHGKAPLLFLRLATCIHKSEPVMLPSSLSDLKSRVFWHHVPGGHSERIGKHAATLLACSPPKLVPVITSSAQAVPWW